MKISIILTTVLAERKVPPRHPLDRLNSLVRFSHELLDDWYGFLPSKDSWKDKFEKNAQRMEDNFKRGNQRCGYYDKNELPHGGPQQNRNRRTDDIMERYDREDPAVGTRQITTGFRKWAERYISNCSGQKKEKYQVKRMNKWNEKLQEHLSKRKPSDESSDEAIAEPSKEESAYCQPGSPDCDECAEGLHDCHEYAMCINTQDSYECECMDGTVADEGACYDIDECINAPCQENASCTNYVGGYECNCDTGFLDPAGDGECMDTNECADEDTYTCQEHAKCVNTVGSYECMCGWGFWEHLGVCFDIDECVMNPESVYPNNMPQPPDCPSNSSCANTEGSFECMCDTGYAEKDGGCTDVDECVFSVCENTQICRNTEGSFICEEEDF